MEKKEEVRISKMEIQLAEEKIRLSIDEAKKLYDVLHDLFGKKVVEKVVEHHHDYWNYRPYIYQSPFSPIRDQILCSTEAGGAYTKQLDAKNEVLSVNLAKAVMEA